MFISVLNINLLEDKLCKNQGAAGFILRGLSIAVLSAVCFFYKHFKISHQQ